MRTYRFTVIDNDDGIECSAENNGFNILELISILDLKKYDLLKQLHDPTSFARTAKTENDDIDISEKEI